MDTIITAFEPFGSHKVNSSQLILKKLNVNARKLVLPVSYASVKSILENIFTNPPSTLLMLGLAPFSTSLELEVIALNVAHSRLKDNDGIVKLNSVIYEDGPLALKTNVDVEEIHNVLYDNKIPSVISYHAGTYLCNYAYYVALYNSYIRNLKTRILFVHVPNATEAVIDDPKKPSLPLDFLSKSIRIILENIDE
ncbi:MAG: hypothetical protein B6U94_04660 [Thermofilum sp. ex4484_79]|nr:MAG: hypothetical protein B6U94_04660 [Thermofilum sp. ex4484_79]